MSGIECEICELIVKFADKFIDSNTTEVGSKTPTIWGGQGGMPPQGKFMTSRHIAHTHTCGNTVTLSKSLSLSLSLCPGRGTSCS